MQLRNRKRRQRGDDVEANGVADGEKGEPPAPWSNLPEYEALVRFVTEYREGDQTPGEGEGEEADGKKRRWWQFWKPAPEPRQPPNDRGIPPSAWLETNIQDGLRSQDVDERRKRFGWNELVAEKENMLAKFFSYFKGPILYGMCGCSSVIFVSIFSDSNICISFFLSPFLLFLFNAKG